MNLVATTESRMHSPCGMIVIAECPTNLYHCGNIPITLPIVHGHRPLTDAANVSLRPTASPPWPLTNHREECEARWCLFFNFSRPIAQCMVINGGCRDALHDVVDDRIRRLRPGCLFAMSRAELSNQNNVRQGEMGGGTKKRVS